MSSGLAVEGALSMKIHCCNADEVKTHSMKNGTVTGGICTESGGEIVRMGRVRSKVEMALHVNSLEKRGSPVIALHLPKKVTSLAGHWKKSCASVGKEDTCNHIQTLLVHQRIGGPVIALNLPKRLP